MKFFANSVFSHVTKQIESQIQQAGGGQKLLYMLPSVPPCTVVELSNRLVNYCTEKEKLAAPLIKVADVLYQEWLKESDPTIQKDLAEIAKREWVDEDGNLTSYRNCPSPESSFLIVLLIGVDKVTDSSSLADFYHCNFRTIWEGELQNNFSLWSRAVLDKHSVGYEEDTVKNYSNLLLLLTERGLADILQISTFLDELDLSTAQNGRDADEILLRSGHRWGLPVFAGYRFSSRRSLGSYIDDSLSFFSYDSFIEERNRIRALKAIDNFVDNNVLGELFDATFREPFNSDEEFIKALRSYVESGDVVSRGNLRKCDFVTIRDRILAYKAPQDPTPKKETVRKLTGGPIEVILNGLWNTLAEFKNEAVKEHGTFAHEALKEIRICSQLFRHNLNGDSSEERTIRAREYLKHLIGGVDHLFENWIDLSLPSDEDQEITIKSTLVRDSLDCQSARSSEPFLQFSIEVYARGWESPTVKQFAWRLPDIESYRVAHELINWAERLISKESGFYRLPVFHVPHYKELMLAKDGEEMRRVLLQCIQDEGNSVFNLIGVEDINKDDLLLKPIQKVAEEYGEFIQTAKESGLHAALYSKGDSLRQAYELACNAYLTDPNCRESPLAAIIYRSFLVVKKRASAEGDRWVWDNFEPSGILTILHPAVLEMLQAQTSYLFSCFSTLGRFELRAPGAGGFRDALWGNYMDLATMQNPLTGLIKDRNRILDTNVQGEDLIHRIGKDSEEEASLTTRLLLRYDAFDEDVSDAELFRRSSESLLIYRILRDYRKLHPHVNDGLSVAIYQNQDLQPIIAAVDHYLKEISEGLNPKDPKYVISITIFTESSDDTAIARWIDQWEERWEAAENQASLVHYKQCQLSIAHRLVSPENYYQQFRQLINDGLEVDIAILNRFIQAGTEGNEFKIVESYDITSRTLKFPILEKSFCASRDPGKKLQRTRVLSNRQLSIATKHAELMARLKNPGTPQGTNHVVLGAGDYTPWQDVVDDLHVNAGWVVCIDSNIDERLVAIKGKDHQEERKVIGFGSGVGSHGEANYTISTEQFNLADIAHRMIASIGEIYPGWGGNIYEGVAKGILKEYSRLSGLSLVKATGVSQYIRDFMAYALTRKLLRPQDDVLCDQLVSLDAYSHWFDSAESDTRPDLIWVVVRLCEEGMLHIDLRLIECKLAKKSERHLIKAQQQLENGLKHLIKVFQPRLQAEDDRPDQRYWWLQLHRLITSKAEIAKSDEVKVLTALERLSEGDFQVEWHAAALTFWTDQEVDLAINVTWPFHFEGQELDISVIAAGNSYVRSLSLAEGGEDLPWSDSTIRFRPVVSDEIPIETSGESEADPSGGIVDNEEYISPEGHGNGSSHEGVKKDTAIVLAKGLAINDPAVESVESGKQQEASSVPKRILLGMTSNGSRPVYWEFGNKELNNRHILIFGTSGMGKTYTIQCLLCELGKHKQNSIIVDYTNGFFKNQLEDEFTSSLQPKEHFVRTDPLPINPFRQQVDSIGGQLIPEGAANTAQRISGVFAEVYNLGDQQKSALYQAVKNGVGSSVMQLGDLIVNLEALAEEKGAIGNSARSVISKIQPFIDQNPFGVENEEGWDQLFTDQKNRCHILQLAGFVKDPARLITEFSLIDLYWYYRSRGTEKSPRVLVLDEVQNLDHREDAPLAQLLREGRKFGFSLILATQIMSNLERDERDRLFNAAHKLFFRPADTEFRTYAEIAANSTGDTIDTWIKRLASLKKGECYSLGPSVNEATGTLELKAFHLQITPLTQRDLDA
jgi:DNA phosphorothioation-dependent restriction protein DptH